MPPNFRLSARTLNLREKFFDEIFNLLSSYGSFGRSGSQLNHKTHETYAEIYYQAGTPDPFEFLTPDMSCRTLYNAVNLKEAYFLMVSKNFKVVKENKVLE